MEEHLYVWVKKLSWRLRNSRPPYCLRFTMHAIDMVQDIIKGTLWL